METNLSAEEYAQILQTIEMFEVIAQSQPDDYQSFDILKEAYMKLGRQAEALQVARKLVTAYINMGLYSNALLECEGVLRFEPDAADVLAIEADLKAKMNQAGAKPKPAETAPIPFDPDNLDIVPPVPDSNQPHTLIATTSTKGGKQAKAKDTASALEDDGNEPFVKFMTHHQLVPADVLQIAMDRVRIGNRNLNGQALGASLLDELSKDTVVDLEVLMANLLTATQFAYMPLESYDIDRQVVKMLPENLTLGRLILPFDVISRTVMIALCNPFDGPGKEAVQSQLDYNIQWYLAKPSAIIKVLRDVYRLDARD